MPGGRPLDWDQIVEKHATRVFRVAFRIVGSVQDAEDVSQEAFLEAYRLTNSTAVQNCTGLLIRIATLRALDRLRRRQSFAALTESDRVSSIEPVDVVSANEQIDRLRHVVSQLPRQQAAVFTMHAFEQMSRDAIAMALGVSLESVSTSLCKARKHLASQMALLSRGGVE